MLQGFLCLSSVTRNMFCAHAFVLFVTHLQLVIAMDPVVSDSRLRARMAGPAAAADGDAASCHSSPVIIMSTCNIDPFIGSEYIYLPHLYEFT